MNRIGSAKLYAAGSVLLPAAGVIIRPSFLWTHILFILWAVAAAAFWIVQERKEHEDRARRASALQQQASIRTLNHHRHDWMNDLQVLYGYIRIGKLERAAASVERIRDKMAVESRIAHLGIPSLVAYLQSFRTLSHNLVLEVDVEDNLTLEDLQLDRDRTADALIEVINAYRFGVKPGIGDPAVLVLKLSRAADELMVELEFAGELRDGDELVDKLEQRLRGTPLQAVSLKQFRHVLLKAPLCA
ncbi:Spo0B domain-containing protein [Paenibacillus sp. RUD330]|uniref:Spo0B domain-containing protein n=1 Tax=Paenibacillus sp. RUD330 TaxID=2023772 RepID=UPI000B927E23|nr:Spo0B domain-containing protein [Paenibacillus sp. RUD330]ASS66320.1 histidine kinase [Paenibacillus sp. RUD330]